MKFTIHNFVDVDIIGSGSLYDYMIFQFDYFCKKNDSESKINVIHIKIDSLKLSDIHSELKQINGKFYSTTEGSFVWDNNGSLCSLNGNCSLKDQTEIILDSRFPKMKSNTILDLLLRVQLIEKNLFLIHASCVENESGAILIPAWKGMGKTAACLKLIETGCNFLGDDKVWLDSNGMVYAYPRYAVIKDSNALEFPNFVNKKTKLKLFIREKIGEKKFLRNNRYVNYLIRKKLQVPVSYHYIEDLFPGTKTSDRATLYKIVTLSKYNQPTTDFKKSNYEKIATKTQNISDVEWNYDLFHLVSAHDILFPDGPSWKEELINLLSKERELMCQAFYKIRCLEAKFPSEVQKIDWNKFIDEIASH